VDVYVQANAKAKKEPSFDEKAREFFRRMEAGDQAALDFWNEVRETSIADFKKLYARLGIEFEHYEGESRYQGKMDAVIEEISQTVGIKESDGATIVDMPYPEGQPPVLLKKNDGSTLYATRDLAAAIDRYERFHFDRSLYVVGAAQSLHFQQLFSVLERMGKGWATRCQHIPFGMVHGMSTRKGQIVRLNDVLDEAHARALEKVKENIAAQKIHTDDPEQLAEQIGLGAIAFGDLKNRRNTDYTFNWDEVLAFEGHTGPYLQYAHARTVNLLKKGGGVQGSSDPSLLTLPEEQALVRQVARLPVSIVEALELNEPSIVARYLLDVASAFSRWYTLGNQDKDKRVIVEGNDALKNARLALADATRVTLANGLTLLGIPTPENM
jgi:arginyl-tRNA synthetase